MPRHEITAEAVVDAPAELAYALIADYRDGHPRIIPRPPFVSLEVEQGGTGEGTVIRYQMRILGRTRTFRAAIGEPEPGRVLTETDLDTGAVTTFAVFPVEDGRKSRITITTRLETHGGLLGAAERSLVTRLLRPVLRREIEQIGDVASGRTRNEG